MFIIKFCSERNMIPMRLLKYGYIITPIFNFFKFFYQEISDFITIKLCSVL